MKVWSSGGIDVLIGGMREGISCVSRERGYGAEINIVNNLLSYYLDICNSYIWQYKLYYITTLSRV